MQLYIYDGHNIRQLGDLTTTFSAECGNSAFSQCGLGCNI